MAIKSFRVFAAAVAAFFMLSDLASAMPMAPAADTGSTASTLVRGGHRGGGGMNRGGGGVRRGGGYRGGSNVVRGGGNVVRGNVVRGGHNTVVVGGRGAWGRGYRWPPGGAIAAGVAVGVLTAGAAAAYTSTRPPAAGLCWYYRDWTYTSGFWDVCP